MSDDNAALLAQIAALSGAIESHRSAPAARGVATGSLHTRRGYGRGAPRGRGTNTHKNRSLVIHAPPSAAHVTPGLVSSSIATSPAAATTSALTSSVPNSTGVSHTTHATTWHAPTYVPRGRPAARGASLRGRGRGAAASSSVPAPRQADVRRGSKMGEVIIDGVTFTFDASGTKLVKSASRPEIDSSAGAGSTSTSETQPPSSSKDALSSISNSTPVRASVDGHGFVRTKGGNLISAEYAEQRRKRREERDVRKQAKIRRRLLARMERLGQEVAGRESLRKRANGPQVERSESTKSGPKGLCSYYTKTGQCRRGLSCSFAHDPHKRALCPRALRPGGCKLPTGTCLLSHTPSEHRSPHCVHYLRAGACRNGEACPYTHPVQPISRDAPACAEFSNLGWCERGKRCEERHTWECPDFARDGKCEKRGCRLLHVIRAPAADEQAELGAAGIGKPSASLPQDGDLFIRDDAAALESAEESEGQHELGKRRYAQVDVEVPDEEQHGLSFRPAKRRARDFTSQQDFIGFLEAEDEEEEDEEEESELESESESESEGEHEDASVDEDEEEHGNESATPSRSMSNIDRTREEDLVDEQGGEEEEGEEEDEDDAEVSRMLQS